MCPGRHKLAARLQHIGVLSCMYQDVEKPVKKGRVASKGSKAEVLVLLILLLQETEGSTNPYHFFPLDPPCTSVRVLDPWFGPMQMLQAN